MKYSSDNLFFQIKYQKCPEFLSEGSLSSPHYNISSGPSQEAGHLYQTIIQGVLVCLFTMVGGVMLLVFCLIVVQECKLLYVWAVRRHNQEVAPPSYLEVTKPPSYSSCQPYNRFQQVEGSRHSDGAGVFMSLISVDGTGSVGSLTETEPPAYSDLYSSSQLDRLVVSIVNIRQLPRSLSPIKRHGISQKSVCAVLLL